MIGASCRANNNILGHGQGYSPYRFGSDLVMWCSSRLSNMTASGGGFPADGAAVTQWDDLSGNGNHLAQGTLAQMPAYRLNAINGLPALGWGATLGTGNNGMVKVFGAPIPQPFTIVLVGKQRVTTGGRWCDSPALTNRTLFERSSGGLWRWHSGGDLNSTTVPEDTNFHVVVLKALSGAAYSRIDGQITTGVGGTSTCEGLTVGSQQAFGANWLDGYIAEVMVISKTLTSNEETGLEDYLGGVYGITVGRNNLWYVNTTTGNDTTNNGKLASRPLLTVGAAVTALSTNNGTISINSNATTPIRAQVTHTGANQISFISSLSTPFVWYGATRYVSGWTNTAGFVWSQLHSTGSAVNVIVRGGPQVFGDTTFPDFRLAQNTSTPTTPNPGEFGVSGSTYYVNLGGLDPNGIPIDIDAFSTCITARSASTLAIANADLQLGYSTALACGVAAGNGYLHIQDSVLSYGGNTGGLATAGVAQLVRALRVGAIRNLNDGFNHHGTAGVPNVMILEDCIGSYNIDEGVSPHDDCVLVVRNSSFNYNGSGGFTAANSAIFDVSNCLFSNNQIVNATVSEGGMTFFDTVSGVVSDCVVKNSVGRGIRKVAGANVTLTRVASVNNGLVDEIL